MTLDTSITFLDNFRMQLKPGSDLDRALECVLFEVKKNKHNRQQYNSQNGQQKK